MIIRITSIDKDGFNGRDSAPGPEHIGKVGAVVAARSVVTANGEDAEYDGAKELAPWRMDLVRIAAQAQVFDFEDVDTPDRMANTELVLCFTVVLKTGIILEVMEHEAQLEQS
jgi:hypothetical protein